VFVDSNAGLSAILLPGLCVELLGLDDAGWHAHRSAG